MKKILCLDFDGVICDSLDETLLTTYNAYQAYKNPAGEPPMATRLEEVPREMAEFFRAYRYLVRPAGEYWLLMDALSSNYHQLDQEEFQKRTVIHSETIAAFEPVFFHTRRRFQEGFREQWLGLHHLFPQFSTAWEGLNNHFRVYIVTTKNFAAVVPLLAHFNIEVPRERIFSKEKSPKKNHAVNEIAGLEGVTPKDIFFVDDHPLHLKDVETTGASIFWASWGYYSENKETGTEIKNLKEILHHAESDY